jgi:fructose-1,6-bisphosphatase/sedoheptulose 1,7-bisphosphatase-like protein
MNYGTVQGEKTRMIDLSLEVLRVLEDAAIASAKDQDGALTVDIAVDPLEGTNLRPWEASGHSAVVE